MRRGGALLQSFDELWKEFSSTCDKAQTHASEKSIHHLRVTARRLASVLDLLPELSETKAVTQLNRSFKKVLKSTGRLRDLQVQLEKISRIPKVDLSRFARTVERREKRELSDVQKQLKRGGGKHLSRKIKKVRE